MHRYYCMVVNRKHIPTKQWTNHLKLFDTIVFHYKYAVGWAQPVALTPRADANYLSLFCLLVSISITLVTNTSYMECLDQLGQDEPTFFILNCCLLGCILASTCTALCLCTCINIRLMLFAKRYNSWNCVCLYKCVYIYILENELILFLDNYNVVNK